jgi:hypothetical protein
MTRRARRIEHHNEKETNEGTDPNDSARFAQRESERERGVGIDSTDAAGRYVADAEAGQTYRALRSRTARWRKQPPTAAQVALLRKLGVNPLSIRSRGDASDKINATRAKRKRNTRETGKKR